MPIYHTPRCFWSLHFCLKIHNEKTSFFENQKEPLRRAAYWSEPTFKDYLKEFNWITPAIMYAGGIAKRHKAISLYSECQNIKYSNETDSFIEQSGKKIVKSLMLCLPSCCYCWANEQCSQWLCGPMDWNTSFLCPWDSRQHWVCRCPFSRDLPSLGIKPSLCTQADSYLLSH